MQRKSRASFANQDEWLDYVRRELPLHEQPFALAYGRAELFLRFLDLRGRSLPAELEAELERILGLSDPDRAGQLEVLNDRIMAQLIEVLFAEARPTLDKEEHTSGLTPRQQTQELLDHLARGTNSSVVSWVRMTRTALISPKRCRSWIGFLSGPMTATFRCHDISSSALGSSISCVSRREWPRRAPF